ncbi:metal-binding protein ZinT [Gracilibacillus sp. S3-1-1]|uniref:Metal-binding protein ZinT n=1 Tax=Gracilibacillus pellucidus TaxID=3095368 RepID=A0ACC6M693_9BACI|nr:metal-binding protein ZinT [Gracilibacillus sp. S3-1-1]MDX8046510.1 metal-binding protein ZinT [Gracilibacillus sp. S3-1-1]
MKKWMINLTSFLLLSFLLVACSGNEDEQVDGAENHADEEHEHDHDDDGHSEEAPEGITIEGVADHYHTGDKIEWTAVLDEDSNFDHWHWYSRESADDEWEAISGQTTNTFTGEAEMNGLEIKAVLYNDSHEASVQSAPTVVVIDDHHGHDEESQQIYNGYFEDEQVADRDLSDFEGDWQSVYPYLLSGDLEEVFEHKAEDGDKTAEEYKEYYTIGYETDVDHITIEDNVVTFYEDEKEYGGEYQSDGYEILNYEAGNRGVRFVYELVDGSDEAPKYIQFSDHNIFPVESHHFHLYWGDDRVELLEEVTNWPTYYPSSLDTDGIVRDMLAH